MGVIFGFDIIHASLIGHGATFMFRYCDYVGDNLRAKLVSLL